MISIITDQSLAYPAAGSGFSPDEAYPEYPFRDISPRANPAYRAVRECLAQAGLDAARFGTPAWNPLGAYIKPGNRVFVLCNFVYHRVAGESEEAFAAKCTHAAVLRPILDYLRVAIGPAGALRFGNAPIQFCRWDAVLSDTGARELLDFYRERGVPAEARDLRLLVTDRNRVGAVIGVERRPDRDAVPVELGAESVLAPLDEVPGVRYRIMNYDPRRLAGFHSGGRHVYVINRHVLEADLVISLSKLKTHGKTGLTCALKSFVGAVAEKDSLPHHRFGSPRIGGDEYPDRRAGVMHRVSAVHDRVQRTLPESRSGSLLRVADKLVQKAAARLVSPLREGEWAGNDTTWRMVLDLARILKFASPDGILGRTPARRFLSLVDGIVAGEGSGPLLPSPVKCGALLFSDDPVLADLACARLMGFDPQGIPMVREAFRKEYGLFAGSDPENEPVFRNGEKMALSSLVPVIGRPFAPPWGWLGRLF
jgi:hypothetical protein